MKNISVKKRRPEEEPIEKTAPDVSYPQVLKYLLKSVREYKGVAILTPILVIGEVVFDVLIPFYTADFITQIKAGATLEYIYASGALLAGMCVAALFFGAAAGFTCAKASAGFGKNLRKDEFYQIQTFSFTTIDRFSNASLVTRLTTDVTNVQQAFMMVIRSVVRCPLILIFSLIAVVTMAGKLALIYVGVLPFLGLGLLSILRITHPIFQRIFKKYDALNESAEENLSAIRVVKSFVREDFEKEKFEVAAEDVRYHFTRAERLLALNSPIMNAAVYTCFVLIVYFCSYMIISSSGADLDVGQFSAMFTYNFMILNGLMILSMMFAQITIAEEGCRRIYEVLTAKTTIPEPDDPVFDVDDGSIDFEDVGFSYSGDEHRMALSDITLHIKSGEVIGIIGSTGSAKSSLVQLIPRLYDTTKGTVRVGGKDVREYDLDTLRNNVAMVLQKNVLFSGTIEENLRWGNPNATDEEVREAARLACADSFIETFPDGYKTYLGQGATNVSGGQKQRLCIARALLKKPKILIMDDSTSAVDTKTDRMIRSELASFMPETTKIIIAQRTGSVEDANRIVVMDHGHINAVGTHEELLRSNEIYREVYLSQNKQSHDEKDIGELSAKSTASATDPSALPAQIGEEVSR